MDFRCRVEAAWALSAEPQIKLPTMGSPITVLIWTLGCVGVVLQFFAWRRLRGECQILQRMREEAFALDVEQLQRWMSEAVTDPDALSTQHLRLVQRAVHSQHPPSAAELVEATQEAESNHWWYILPNLLLAVTLVIGLAGTMLILQQVLKGESLQNMIRASTGLSVAPSEREVRDFTQAATGSITAIYQGFGGAFSASLTGIAWTVVLTATSLVFLRPAQGRFSSLLHRVTLEILLPKFVPRGDSLFEQLSAAAQSLSDITVNSGEVLRQIGEDMGARLLVICETIGTSLDEFSGQAAKAKEFSSAVDRSSRALERTLEKFSTVFNQGGPFQTMADQMARQSTQLVSSTEHLKSTVQEIGENYEEPLDVLRQNTQDIQKEIVALKVQAQEVLRQMTETFGAVNAVRLHKVREEERSATEVSRQQAIEASLKGLLNSAERNQVVATRWETWMGLMQNMTARTVEAAEQQQQTLKLTQSSIDRLQVAVGASSVDGDPGQTSSRSMAGALETMLSTMGRLETVWTQNNATLAGLEALVREFRAFAERPPGYWTEHEEQKLAWIAEIARRLPDSTNGQAAALQEPASHAQTSAEPAAIRVQPRNPTEKLGKGDVLLAPEGTVA